MAMNNETRRDWPMDASQNTSTGKMALPPVNENVRLADAVPGLHQTSKCIPASVRNADAIVDQMKVTQVME
jgi:hypothetical protein